MEKKNVIAAFAVGAAIVAVGISYSISQRNVEGPVTLPDSHPRMIEINWVKKKSQECGGDIEKLSAEDKAKVVALMGQQYAAQSVKSYYKAP